MSASTNFSFLTKFRGLIPQQDRQPILDRGLNPHSLAAGAIADSLTQNLITNYVQPFGHENRVACRRLYYELRII
jgi:hypothetical protein